MYPRFEVIAHRGASRERPENTLPAFLRALELGVDAIELDVHATRDGVVVVHHDPTLPATGRTATPSRRPIAELTAEEVRTLRIGDWSVPTLDEVLAAVGDCATLYVEVKGRDIERLVVAAIARSPTRCAVHSFDHRVARRVRALAPELAAGVLLSSYLLDPVAVLRQAGARDYWSAWEMIDEDLVREVHGAGGRVIAWTVNDASTAAALAALGVDGICSDDVALLRE